MIAVKFCGNCNPQIVSNKVYLKVSECFNVVSAFSPAAKLMLVLSGCPVDCAERPTVTLPEVVVAGSSLNYETCPEAELPDRVVAKIKEVLME